MYIVMIHIKNSINDQYDVTYTGIQHDTIEQAEVELNEADERCSYFDNFDYAYIIKE